MLLDAFLFRCEGVVGELGKGFVTLFRSLLFPFRTRFSRTVFCGQRCILWFGLDATRLCSCKSESLFGSFVL